MSKILIVLACLCAYVVIGAVIHPSKTDKAGNLSVIRHIDYQMRLSGNASRVGRQSSGDQLLGYHGYDCNGGGWYAPCNGGCYVFTDVHSLLLLGEYSHGIALYSDSGCDGEERVFNADPNTCYNAPDFYFVSARCY